MSVKLNSELFFDIFILATIFFQNCIYKTWCAGLQVFTQQMKEGYVRYLKRKGVFSFMMHVTIGKKN